jgi:hypothetical protein
MLGGIQQQNYWEKHTVLAAPRSRSMFQQPS